MQWTGGQVNKNIGNKEIDTKALPITNETAKIQMEDKLFKI